MFGSFLGGFLLHFSFSFLPCVQIDRTYFKDCPIYYLISDTIVSTIITALCIADLPRFRDCIMSRFMLGVQLDVSSPVWFPKYAPYEVDGGRFDLWRLKDS